MAEHFVTKEPFVVFLFSVVSFFLSLISAAKHEEKALLARQGERDRLIGEVLTFFLSLSSLVFAFSHSCNDPFISFIFTKLVKNMDIFPRIT